MATYTVHVTRSLSTSVQVEAASAYEAETIVGRVSFTLPPIEQWSGNKDWTIEADDEDDYTPGKEV